MEDKPLSWKNCGVNWQVPGNYSFWFHYLTECHSCVSLEQNLEVVVLTRRQHYLPKTDLFFSLPLIWRHFYFFQTECQCNSAAVKLMSDSNNLKPACCDYCDQSKTALQHFSQQQQIMFIFFIQKQTLKFTFKTVEERLQCLSGEKSV